LSDEIVANDICLSMFDNEKRAGVCIREYVDTHKYFVQYNLIFIVLFTSLLFHPFTIHHACIVDRGINMAGFLKYRPTLRDKICKLNRFYRCNPAMFCNIIVI